MRSLLLLVVMLAVVGCDTPTAGLSTPSTYVLMQDRYRPYDLGGVHSGSFTLDPPSGVFEDVLRLSTGELRETAGTFIDFDGGLWLHSEGQEVARCRPIEAGEGEWLSCVRAANGLSYLYLLQSW